MPFDQSTITEVKPPVWDGSALHLEWTSTAPAGTVFQVYVARALTWHGTARWVAIPMPSSQVRIDIGAVGPGEETTDFSAVLPGAPGDRAHLSWLGGSYLDPSGNDDVAGFTVYGEPVARRRDRLVHTAGRDLCLPRRNPDRRIRPGRVRPGGLRPCSVVLRMDEPFAEIGPMVVRCRLVSTPREIPALRSQPRWQSRPPRVPRPPSPTERGSSPHTTRRLAP